MAAARHAQLERRKIFLLHFGSLFLLGAIVVILPLDLFGLTGGVLDFIREEARIDAKHWSYAKWNLAATVHAILYVMLFLFTDFANAAHERVTRYVIGFAMGGVLVIAVGIVGWFFLRANIDSCVNFIWCGRLASIIFGSVVLEWLVALYLLGMDLVVLHRFAVTEEKRRPFEDGFPIDIAVAGAFVFILIFLLFVVDKKDTGAIEVFASGSSAMALMVGSVGFAVVSIYRALKVEPVDTRTP